MLPLTKFAIRESGERMERGIVRFLTVAKAADGSLECVAEVVFGGAPHLLSRGGRDGKPVPGSDANGPCAWTRRAPRMVVAGGDPAVHRPLAVPQGIVASRAPRRVRRTLGEGACEAAKPGNWFRRFLLWQFRRPDRSAEGAKRRDLSSAISCKSPKKGPSTAPRFARL